MLRIEKEKLEDLYIKQRLTSRQIAKIYNLSWVHVCNILRKYKISPIKARRDLEKKKDIELTQIQKDFLIGTLLGDGCITYTNPNKTMGRLEINHCEKQKEYFIWKTTILGTLVNKIRVSEYIDKKGKKSNIFGFKSLSHAYFADLEKFFYTNRIKEIKPELKEMINPLVLAVWVMDDAFLKRNSIYICTNCFTYEEQLMLLRIFKEKFNINGRTTIPKKYINQYNLVFDKENSIKLGKIIEPYMVECMKYKLPKGCKNIS